VRVLVNLGDSVRPGSPLLELESAEVADAHADYLAAEARTAVAMRAAERARGLLASRVTSQRAVEEAEGELQIAEAERDAAQSRLLAYGTDPASRDAPGRVTLTSPIRGGVVKREVHVGEWIEPGDAVIEIIDLDELWLVGALFERDLRHAQVGQRAQVDVRALPRERFAGTVVHVGETLDEANRTAALRVVLANPGHRLRPGMFATARLEAEVESGARVLAVPVAAIQQLDDRNFVFVPSAENTFSVRWIQLGAREGDWVEIVDGLSSGEQVVVGGSVLLRGQLLRGTLGEEEEGEE
jgi:cobalt-zinc-cadmium efflux system membrane fusion protein